MEIRRIVPSKVSGKLIEKVTVIDTHELAWAAGFFDGEGTIHTELVNNNSVNPMLRVTVPQKGKSSLRRFRKAVLGLGRYTWKNSPTGIIDIYRANTFEEAQAVIALLWKYLGEDKRIQARLAILKYHQNYKGNLMWRRGKLGINKDLHKPSSPATVNAVKIVEIQNEM